MSRIKFNEIFVPKYRTYLIIIFVILALVCVVMPQLIPINILIYAGVLIFTYKKQAKMKERVNLNDEDGITILKDKGYNLKIEVDTNKRSVSDALKLLNPDNIIDINISNIPLEDIISAIYKKEEKKWKNIYLYSNQK